MTKDKERGSSTSSIQPDRVQEKLFKLSGERCTKGAWRRFFECTGQLFLLLLKVKSLESSQECISLETWALPITVVVAVVAYAVLAAVFYNTDVV